MTDVEAFGFLRVTLPDIVAQVYLEGVGLPETREQARALALKLAASKTLDEAVGYADQLETLAQGDPPFHDALYARTKPIRDKAEAESPAGQVRQAVRDVENAAKAGASVAKDVGTIALVGLGLWVLVEAGSLARTLKRGGGFA